MVFARLTAAPYLHPSADVEPGLCVEELGWYMLYMLRTVLQFRVGLSDLPSSLILSPRLA